MAESEHRVGKPTHAELYAKAQERYRTDAEFHALVHTTAGLLGWSPSTLILAVHVTQLADELVKAHDALTREQARLHEHWAKGQASRDSSCG